MPDELHRHRSSRHPHPFLTFLRSYWVEIVIVLGLALSVFLLFEQMNIRGTLLGWARAAVDTGLTEVGLVIQGLLRIRSRLGLSELIAIPLLIGVVALLIWRVRWRLQRTTTLSDLHCPRCGGVIHRVHRHTLDHMVSAIVPVRRYHCGNRDCGWSGLRVSVHSYRGRGHSRSSLGEGL